MKNYIKHSALNYNEYPNRVCLPYGSNLFDISRWILKEKSSNYEIISESISFDFNTKEVIEIYNLIVNKCMVLELESSFIRNKESRNLLYFDVHERFSLFAGDFETVKYLFPFDREIIWENYHLYQDDDADDFKKDVFNAINSVPS